MLSFKQLTKEFGSMLPFGGFLLIIILVATCYKKIINMINLHKLPGPKRYPFLGNLLELAVDHSKYFKDTIDFLINC